jgi:hypothetical protein
MLFDVGVGALVDFEAHADVATSPSNTTKITTRRTSPSC